MKRTTLLVILDGWGYRTETTFNAIHHASTPTWDRLWRDFPHTLLDCSGEQVGLPAGQMGNSEVGHITIGSGRIVRQELSRIDQSIADGSFARNPALASLLNESVDRTLHVFGLLSPGGVHSHENHIFAAIGIAIDAGRDVVLHAFLDGRDTPPSSAEPSIQRTLRMTAAAPNFQLASICGRYYAMDRDRRWKRTRAAYDMYANGTTQFRARDGIQALRVAYDRGETDEFVIPTIVGPDRTLREGDDVLFMNFRADRARQLCRAFTSDKAGFEFPRTVSPKLNRFVCLTSYADNIDASSSRVRCVETAYKPNEIDDTFAVAVANANKTQLRIAETEKYAHVTYFFSGGSESAQQGETRRFLPSPNVATYDLQPEMNAVAVAEEIAVAVRRSQHDTIICNLANADMVGHTGNFSAALKAVECIDHCLDTITAAVLETNSHCVITADHGNIEEMVKAGSEQPHTAHTVGRVPLVYVGAATKALAPTGGLQDVAPTLLALMGIPKPAAMTGRSLLR